MFPQTIVLYMGAVIQIVLKIFSLLFGHFCCTVQNGGSKSTEFYRMQKQQVIRFLEIKTQRKHSYTAVV